MKSLAALAALSAIALLGACDVPMSPTPYYVPPPTPLRPLVVEPIVADPAPYVPQEPVTVDPVPSSPVARAPGDTCGAGELQTFVGSVAPQPFPAAGPVRVYAQGDPVTMDHNPQRVNVVVNPADRRRIVSISCG